MRRAAWVLVLASCSVSDSGDDRADAGSETSVGESQGSTGDGDGDPTGDGDPSTGDGDGDPSTGDGDGDPSTGDGDGDATTGEPGSSLGVFDLTYYWVTYEGDYPGPADTDVGDCQAVTLATVTGAFANALKLEGTGKLLDDRILNIAGCGCGGGFDCFAELDPNQYPWGQGSQGNALEPFHSIATDTSVLPFGTSVYAPSLDGVVLPGGEVHDGCLRAGDVGGGINGMHIDWFVGLKTNYQTLDPDVPETVELFEGGTQCP